MASRALGARRKSTRDPRQPRRSELLHSPSENFARLDRSPPQKRPIARIRPHWAPLIMILRWQKPRAYQKAWPSEELQIP